MTKNIENQNKTRIPLFHILEEMFGISQIDSKDKLNELLKKLESLPPEILNKPIDFSKLSDSWDQKKKGRKK